MFTPGDIYTCVAVSVKGGDIFMHGFFYSVDEAKSHFPQASIISLYPAPAIAQINRESGMQQMRSLIYPKCLLAEVNYEADFSIAKGLGPFYFLDEAMDAARRLRLGPKWMVKTVWSYPHGLEIKPPALQVDSIEAINSAAAMLWTEETCASLADRFKWPVEWLERLREIRQKAQQEMISHPVWLPLPGAYYGSLQRLIGLQFQQIEIWPEFIEQSWEILPATP
jgi:hypothetical protein